MTASDDPSLFHKDHLIHLRKQMQSVGQKDHDAVCRQLFQTRKYLLFCLFIQR